MGDTGRQGVTRREFLALSATSAAALAAGCAINPVTGQNELMLVTADEELKVDREYSPHQFSADYGAVADPALNAYLDGVGRSLARLTHRPQMPYSFRALNAVYVNAYTFPGGSVAATRGILVGMESEAELAALLGHELGHVNARHTAQQMSAGLLTQLIVAGAAVAVGAGTKNEDAAGLVAGLGAVAGGAFLARYSRQHERQADGLAMEYATRAGYSPQGLVDLMDLLRSLQKEKPNALEVMFASHPMSDERYATAVREAGGAWAASRGLPLYRERYLDHTAALRAQRKAVAAFQRGGEEAAKKRWDRAEEVFREGLRLAPDDYAGLLMMAECQLARRNPREAQRYAEAARGVYPSEPRARFVRGLATVRLGRWDQALSEFDAYTRELPGNPESVFWGGYACEGMGRRPAAAERYRAYLGEVGEGEHAQHAARRLREWGYLKGQ